MPLLCRLLGTLFGGQPAGCVKWNLTLQSEFITPVKLSDGRIYPLPLRETVAVCLCLLNDARQRGAAIIDQTI